jgi:predicted transcriptional regulator
LARIEVTEAESELLEALWRCGPLTPPRLFAEVRQRRDWADATVKTLLGRLMHKKAVRSERVEGRLIYRPLISREAYVAGLVDDLVGRAFGGDHAALKAYLSVGESGG